LGYHPTPLADITIKFAQKNYIQNCNHTRILKHAQIGLTTHQFHITNSKW